MSEQGNRRYTTPAEDPAWLTESEQGLTGPAPETSAPAPAEPDPPRSATAAFSRAAIVSARERPQAQIQAQRAGFTVRAIAFLVDLTLLGLISSAILAGGALAYGLEELSRLGDGDLASGTVALVADAPGVGAAVFLLLFVLASGYFIYFHGALSRTPGKALLGLRVVKDSGLPLDLATAMARWSAFVACILGLGLGLLWTAFSEVQQGLHDKIARTYVLRG